MNYSSMNLSNSLLNTLVATYVATSCSSKCVNHVLYDRALSFICLESPAKSINWIVPGSRIMSRISLDESQLPLTIYWQDNSKNSIDKILKSTAFLGRFSRVLA